MLAAKARGSPRTACRTPIRTSHARTLAGSARVLHSKENVLSPQIQRLAVKGRQSRGRMESCRLTAARDAAGWLWTRCPSLSVRVSPQGWPRPPDTSAAARRCGKHAPPGQTPPRRPLPGWRQPGAVLTRATGAGHRTRVAEDAREGTSQTSGVHVVRVEVENPPFGHRMPCYRCIQPFVL